MSKEKIEKAFSDAGKKLAELVKVCEQHGHELSDEQFNKGFGWLQVTMQTVMAKAQTARTLSVAANAAFSFDMALPAPIVLPIVEGKSAPMPMTTEQAGAEGTRLEGGAVRPPETPSPARPGTRPIGRLVGSKEVLFGEPEKPSKIKLDPIGEINFLDPNKDMQE